MCMLPDPGYLDGRTGGSAEARARSETPPLRQANLPSEAVVLHVVPAYDPSCGEPITSLLSSMPSHGMQMLQQIGRQMCCSRAFGSGGAMPPGRGALTGAAPLSPLQGTRPGSAGRLAGLNSAGLILKEPRTLAPGLTHMCPAHWLLSKVGGCCVEW